MGAFLNTTVCALLAVFLYYFFDEWTNEQAGKFLRDRLNTSYDYIVVGGGSAGCVVASRLSEDPNVSVLLLEAGPDDRGESVIKTPGQATLLQHGKFDWEYYTEPQKHGLAGFKERRSYWPRGKVLGGSSSLNSMVYIRGHKLDFDRWEKSGADGWSYEKVLPFFIKSEGMTDGRFQGSKYHGFDGPLKVSVPKTMPLTDILLQSGQELGLKINDPNGEDMVGISQAQSTSYRGIRMSTSRSFLHPVMSRENLHVRPETHVTKILFEGKKAVGVEMIYRGKKETVRSSKEIILSAGAIGSPQILLLSGVGPKQHLESLHIPVVADLPVGSNLQDHLFFEYSIGVNQTVTATPELQESLWSKIQHRLFGTGVLSSSHYVETNVFDYTDEKSRNQGWPDLQIMFHQTPWIVEALKGFRYSEDTLKESSQRNLQKDMFACEASLLRPESRGTLKLRSRDPFDYPLLDPNYLERQEDADMLVRGIRYCQRFLNTSPLKIIGAVPADKPNKFCKSHKYDTDEYWQCMVRQRIHTIYHHSGTCKMGRKEDPTTVVDPRLRVKSISGLRVADCSIMPYITSGNTNAPAIMIGEKVAQMIRDDSKSKK